MREQEQQYRELKLQEKMIKMRTTPFQKITTLIPSMFIPFKCLSNYKICNFFAKGFPFSNIFFVSCHSDVLESGILNHV